MNSPSSISAAPATTAETNLGWNAMPAYGEVMPVIRGTQHLDINAPLAPEPRVNNQLLASFWNAFRGVNAAA